MAMRPPRRGPRQRRGSSSRMPATAAIDNETLDHLLSVVDEGLQYSAFPAIRKSALFEGDAEVLVRLSSQSPHRRVQTLDGQRIHPPAENLPHRADRGGGVPLARGPRIEPAAGRIG